MSLRRRTMLIFGVVLAVVFGLNFALIVAAQRQVLNNAKMSEMSNVAKVVTSVLQDRALVSARTAEIIADQPWVAKAFRAGDRAGLLQGLQHLYTRLTTVYGGKFLEFYTPPAQSFLFVQKPDMPSTDFSAVRPMLVAASVQGVNQLGLELGPSGLADRGVAPVKDAAGLIGVVEYAAVFDSLLNEISRLTDTQLAVLIDEDHWDKARKKDKEFTPPRDQVIAGNRAVYSTDWDLTSAIVTAEALAPTRGNRITSNRYKGTEYGLLTMPLMDYSGEQIGFMVSVRSFDKQNAAFVDAIRLGLIRVLLSYILSLGAAAIIFNSLLIRPITDLLGKLQKLADGETNEPLAIAGRTDEVGALFQVAEQLRLELRKTSDSTLEKDVP